MTWLATISWFLVGLYGIFYNLSYIDEAKYLIKGWLISTGQIGYYSTPEFFYQHMPGGLLWFGFTQRLIGPSLLAARIQSFILSLIIFFLTYLVAKTLAGKVAGKLSLLIISLAPVMQIYYASAVPQGLSILVLLLAFLFLSKKKYLLSTFWFTLAFIVRENFLFTLIAYLVFLFWQLKLTKDLFKNFAVVFFVLAVFFLPGWPGIMKVFYNFPGISNLLPITQTEKAVLGQAWFQQRHDLNHYLLAVKEFGVIYFSFFVSLLLGSVVAVKKKLSIKKNPVWYFLVIVFALNLFAHIWAAFQLSPRSVVSYLAYFAPLAAIAAGISLVKQEKLISKLYLTLFIISLLTLRYAGIVGKPNQPTAMRQINQSIKPLKNLIVSKQKIIWLAEPMSLFLAGKVSYYPLINHTNYFKSSNDTAIVASLGFWNETIMTSWLNGADLVVIDNNRLELMRQSSLARPAAETILNQLESGFKLITVEDYIWPGNLSFYQPKSIIATYD